MKTEQAQALADELVASTGKKGNGEPTAKLICQAVGSLMVNLARIADATDERNEAMRAGTWPDRG